MKKLFRQPVAIFLLIAFTLLGVAHAFNLNTKKSTITIVAKQMNVPLSARFNQFNATIDYNPTNPEAARANVEIDISSFDLGDAEYNKEVLKKEWFNAAQFPKATYVSSSIKNAGNGKLTASGKLTIKGKTLDVSFPVTLVKEGNASVFNGELPIRRRAFNVGEGEWSDTSMVADEVVIKFHLVVP